MTLFVVVLTLLSAPADEAQSHLAAAEDAYAHGDVRGARHAVDEALAVDPQNTDALLLAARLARKTGEPEVAIQHLNQLIALDPDDDDARYEMALAHAEVGDKAAAGSALDGLLAREPQREEAVTAKARLTSGSQIEGIDPGGLRPLARVGLGMTYDSNVLLASNVVPTNTGHSTPTVDVDAAIGFTVGHASQLNGMKPLTLIARLTDQTSTESSATIRGVVPSTLGLIAIGLHRFGDYQTALDLRYTELWVDSFADHIQREVAPTVWAARTLGAHTLRALAGLEYRKSANVTGVAGPDNITYEGALRDSINLHPVQLIVDLRGDINKGTGDVPQTDSGNNAGLVGFKELAAMAYAWTPIVSTLSAFGLGEVTGRKFDSDLKETTWRAELGVRYAFDVFELHGEYEFMKNVSNAARSFDRNLVSVGIRYWYQ